MPDNITNPLTTLPSRATRSRFALASLAALACLGMAHSGVSAQGSPGGGLFQSNANIDTKLDDPRPEGGWDALARLLDKAKPNVDTRLDPTATQVTDRIEKLLATNRVDEALALVEKRQAELDARSSRSGTTDIQLQFQRARVLAQLGRKQEAEAVYTQMTQLYPELPEPWNNLAILYVARGDLERASQALNNALQADPTNTMARGNLADVQLMMARQSYAKAGRSPAQLPPINPGAPASAAP